MKYTLKVAINNEIKAKLKKYRCISERASNIGQLEIGSVYLLDLNSTFTDADGDTYGTFIKDDMAIGILRLDHFEALE